MIYNYFLPQVLQKLHQRKKFNFGLRGVRGVRTPKKKWSPDSMESGLHWRRLHFFFGVRTPRSPDSSGDRTPVEAPP